MNRIGVAIAASAATLGALLSTPAAADVATAAQDYQAGPFSSSSSCTSTRLTYVRQGGFTYVGPCYRQTNGRYYFNYH